MASVALEIDESLAWITLNRPEKLNAIDAAMLGEIEQALDAVESDATIRAVILNGAGRAFSAGFDLTSSGASKVAATPEEVRRELTRDFDVILRFWDCSKPIVAAVHGWCLGSSMEIAAVCDLTIAAEGCRFGAPEVRYGNGIVCLVLPWMLGLKHANEILLLGDKDLDAKRAEAIGLVNRVVPEERLLDEATRVAAQLASNDALAVQLTRQAVRRSFEMAGFRRALEEALEFDIRIETTDTVESKAFNDVMKTKGLKAALDWRASRFSARRPE